MDDYSLSYIEHNKKRPEIYFSRPKFKKDGTMRMAIEPPSFVLSQYTSLIWTERDRSPGDFQLTIDTTDPEGIPFNIYRLAQSQNNTNPNLNKVSVGWWVNIPWDISTTYMIIESIDASYKDGAFNAVIKGQSIESILSRRVIGPGWVTGNDHQKPKNGNKYVWSKTPTFVTKYCPDHKDVGVKIGGQSDLADTLRSSAAPLLHHLWSIFCMCFKPSWTKERITTSERRRLTEEAYEHLGNWGEFYRPGKTSDSNSGVWSTGLNPEILYDPIARYSSGEANYNPDHNWYIPAAAFKNDYNLQDNYQFSPNATFYAGVGRTRYWSCESATQNFRDIPELYLSSAGFYNFGRKDSELQKKIYGTCNRAYYAPSMTKAKATTIAGNITSTDLSGQTFMEYLQTLCSTFDASFRIYPDPALTKDGVVPESGIDAWFLEVMPGRDRSQKQKLQTKNDTTGTTRSLVTPTVFSLTNDTITGCDFKFDAKGYKNAAAIAGQTAEGSKSGYFEYCTYDSRNTAGYKGLDRREIYVDEVSSRKDDYGYGYTFYRLLADSTGFSGVAKEKFYISDTRNNMFGIDSTIHCKQYASNSSGSTTGNQDSFYPEFKIHSASGTKYDTFDKLYNYLKNNGYTSGSSKSTRLAITFVASWNKTRKETGYAWASISDKKIITKRNGNYYVIKAEEETSDGWYSSNDFLGATTTASPPTGTDISNWLQTNGVVNNGKWYNRGSMNIENAIIGTRISYTLYPAIKLHRWNDTDEKVQLSIARSTENLYSYNQMVDYFIKHDWVSSTTAAQTPKNNNSVYTKAKVYRDETGTISNTCWMWYSNGAPLKIQTAGVDVAEYYGFVVSVRNSSGGQEYILTKDMRSGHSTANYFYSYKKAVKNESEDYVFYSGPNSDYNPGKIVSVQGNSIMTMLWGDSSSSTSGFSIEDRYTQYLDYKGMLELNKSDNCWNLAVSAELNKQNPVYEYKKDFNLGDYVSVLTPFAGGLGQKARVSEFIRSWDTDGYTEYPTFVMETNSLYIDV